VYINFEHASVQYQMNRVNSRSDSVMMTAPYTLSAILLLLLLLICTTNTFDLHIFERVNGLNIFIENSRFYDQLYICYWQFILAK